MSTTIYIVCFGAKISKSKMLSKIVANNILFFFHWFCEKITIGISYELSAWQMIQMKFQASFSLKNKNQNQKVCCSCEFKNYLLIAPSMWTYIIIMPRQIILALHLIRLSVPSIMKPKNTYVNFIFMLYLDSLAQGWANTVDLDHLQWSDIVEVMAFD